MSRSNVVSRDSETATRTERDRRVVLEARAAGAGTGRGARRSARRGRRARRPRAPRSWRCPCASRRSAVFGPTPGSRPGGACANRAQASSRESTTKPRGFSASEATLATSLLGPIPTEQPRPVASRISAIRRRIAACGATRSLRSRYASSRPATSTRRDGRAHAVHHLARDRAVGRRSRAGRTPRPGTGAGPARPAWPTRRRTRGPRTTPWSRRRAARCRPRRRAVPAAPAGAAAPR